MKPGFLSQRASRDQYQCTYKFPMPAPWLNVTVPIQNKPPDPNAPVLGTQNNSNNMAIKANQMDSLSGFRDNQVISDSAMGVVG